MAFTAYHYLNGSTTVKNTLLAAGDGANNIKSITISNNRSGNIDHTLDLYLQKDETIFYFLKNVYMPKGSTLHLDNESMLSFDNSFNGYDLNLELASGDIVTVMIKK